MAVVREGREAVTEYEVLRRFSGHPAGEFSEIAAKLKTGRTHQIRVHLAYLGHPVLGDAVYGQEDKAFSLRGQVLHAEKLEFDDPVTGERREFTAPLPAYFAQLLAELAGNC
jgi:23S rRNA pseudouridine1911/1915/1917 synthase